MFFKKKVKEEKEEIKEPLVILQIEKEVEGLKKPKSSYKSSEFASPIFGLSVKDDVIVPDSHGLGDTIREYDAFRDEKDKKLPKNYDEFKSMSVSNKTRAEIFGSDVYIKERTLKVDEKPKAPAVDIPFNLGNGQMVKESVVVTDEVVSDDFVLFDDDEITIEEKPSTVFDTPLDISFDDEKIEVGSNIFGQDTVTIGVDDEIETEFVFGNIDDFKEEPDPFKDIKPTKPIEKPIVKPIVDEPTTIIRNKPQYKLPPISLLKKKDFDRFSKPEWIDQQIEIINNTLRQFDVDGGVVDYSKGPSITRYEVKLSPGVNVKKVTAIEDNFKMNLSAKTIRIEAPIPGKSTVGIEVPNVMCSDVAFGNVCDTDEFRNSEPLNVGIGLDISGKTIYTDIAKMPHGLVAGQTGSGKSVCINTIIVSLLLKNSPDDLKLMMIDPKVIELSCYNDLPHLITPVINDPKMAALGLKWAVDEMEKRYRQFAEVRARNIVGYNEAIKSMEGMKKMPYIVIVIDELADLMMAASQDVEDAIKRLTAKSRAAGIHLLVATQRPTTDVVKGTIKANIPSRIAFKVSSYTDSITILDNAGAENLLGRGDMFIRLNDSTIRVQGAYVSDGEIDAICDFIRAESAPEYLFTHENLSVQLSKREVDDELFPDVARFVVNNENPSINRIQKEFNVGFNRAQKLFEMLIDQGIISNGHGGKREILVNNQELEEMLNS